MKEIKDIKLIRKKFEDDSDKVYTGRIVIEDGFFEGTVRDQERQNESLVFGSTVDKDFIDLIFAETNEEITPTEYKAASFEYKTKTSIHGHDYVTGKYTGDLISKTAYYEWESGDCKIEVYDPYFYCSVEEEDYTDVKFRVSTFMDYLNDESRELYRLFSQKRDNKCLKKTKKTQQ